MPKVIAVAGKGGTGKTTISALTVRSLIKNKMKPVLAIDADPNSNLGESLGIDVTRSIGQMREDFYQSHAAVPKGMEKGNYLEMLMNQVIIENKGFDLLVMGRQEGPGCYCFVNNVLRKFSEDLASNYKYMLFDNEAGLEHLSRRTTHKIDELWLVTDHAIRGLRAVKRIKEMVADLKLNVASMKIIVNRVPDKLADAFQKELDEIGLPLAATIPVDDNLMEFDFSGQSLMELDDNSPSVLAVEKMLKEILV